MAKIKNIKYKIILFVLFIGVMSLSISLGLKVSPKYSLKQLDIAISEQDIVTFDKYVDLDKVVDNAIDQIWQYYSNPTVDNKKTRWTDLRTEISQSLLSVAKPNLSHVIKKEIYNYILTGKLGENNPHDKNPLISLLMTLAKERINPEEWEFQTINYSKVNEDAAFLGLTYYDHLNEANFIVEMKMRNMNGYWQLIEITNISQLFNTFFNIDNN